MMKITYEYVIVYDGKDYVLTTVEVHDGVVQIWLDDLDLDKHEDVKGVFNLSTCPDLNSCILLTGTVLEDEIGEKGEVFIRAIEEVYKHAEDCINSNTIVKMILKGIVKQYKNFKFQMKEGFDIHIGNSKGKK